MHSLFTPVDTLDTSTYLHSVVYPTIRLRYNG